MTVQQFSEIDTAVAVWVLFEKTTKIIPDVRKFLCLERKVDKGGEVCYNSYEFKMRGVAYEPHP
jgi:hypothetical protein